MVLLFYSKVHWWIVLNDICLFFRMVIKLVINSIYRRTNLSECHSLQTFNQNDLFLQEWQHWNQHVSKYNIFSICFGLSIRLNMRRAKKIRKNLTSISLYIFCCFCFKVHWSNVNLNKLLWIFIVQWIRN